MDRESILIVLVYNIERSEIWDLFMGFSGDILEPSTLIVTVIIRDRGSTNLLKLSIKSRILHATDGLS